MAGMLLMVFVYWGWDTTVSVNEETADADRIPGTAGVLSTVILLGTYFMVILSVQLFAGFGSSGIGLGNTANQNDVLSPSGPRSSARGALGTVLARLLHLDGDVLVGRDRDDHDPAERADDPVDGVPQGAAADLRQGAPALPDPELLHDLVRGHLRRSCTWPSTGCRAGT